MEKTLVTCPVCKTDQHVYAKKICKHVGNGGIMCLGSKTPIKELNFIVKCWQCSIKDSDKKPRIYKEIKSGRIFNVVRNFCSDECETVYINEMDKRYPELTNEFELIQTKD